MKSEQDYRVRECIHRADGAPGHYYDGRTYVKHLQRLPSQAALRTAAKPVAPSASTTIATAASALRRGGGRRSWSSVRMVG